MWRPPVSEVLPQVTPPQEFLSFQAPGLTEASVWSFLEAREGLRGVTQSLAGPELENWCNLPQGWSADGVEESLLSLLRVDGGRQEHKEAGEGRPQRLPGA